MRMSLSRRLRPYLLLLLTWLPHLTAAQSSSDTAALVAAERWSEAARLLLRGATAIVPTTGGLPQALARAGFLGDALDTVARMHPNSQSWGYLELVRGISSLDPQMQAQLLDKAAQAARADGIGNRLMFRAGSLARLAMFHSQAGNTASATQLYAESLQTATLSLQDKDNSGYRPITAALLDAAPDAVPEAMFEQLRSLLPAVRDPQNRTFACVDLAVAAQRQRMPSLANAFIACGLVEAKALDRASQRDSAEERLGVVAVMTGFRHPKLEKFAKVKALREAREGRCDKAYAIAARQGQNLYVDFAQDLLSALVDDALVRGDMDCALYIAHRPLAPVGVINAAIWQRIADKQAARGERQQAFASYRSASYALTEGHTEYRRSEYDVRRALQLADTMRTAGLAAESTQLVRQAHGMLVKIFPRNIDGRLSASIALAPALWRIGETVAAKQLLADACGHLAHYDVSGTGRIRKAQHLAAAGDAAAQIAALSGARKIRAHSRR